MNFEFDVIVVGGGHAGCEAAGIAAKLGSKTLLISIDLTKLAQMSCNPAMGGVGKGQILREIDVLGGYSAKVTDLTTIHFRMLNSSKGPAMWSPRAQCDRMLFSIEWRKYLESLPNLYLWQDEVTDINFDSNKNEIIGVKTRTGANFNSKAIVLTNGTFLNGKIHIGTNNFLGGRIGELGANSLTASVAKLGFVHNRMKTGTPVRIDGRTVDFSELIEQESDRSEKFSFDSNYYSKLPERKCYILHTNVDVHNELKKGFKFSPLFTGVIKGVGPRYCPSIEDKVHTFAQKDSHQLFLEPEGVSTYEMYLNGFSSSLPLDIQYKALKLLPGMKNVHILRPGYAIEYDYFDPTQLTDTLESKLVKNLFFAGQINGTTGYEEAAGQGLVAGINAHLNAINSETKFTLARDQAYIGVLIDDLINKGVDEPYRMFTSRAEFRILLRQDNTDERLVDLARQFGLLSEELIKKIEKKYDIIDSIEKDIYERSVSPNTINQYLSKINSAEIKQKRKLVDIISRPEVKLTEVNNIYNIYKNVNTDQNFNDILDQVEIRIKYKGYIEKEKLNANKIERLDYVKIPDNFDFNLLNSISTEARQKLTKHKPKTISQAKKIPGVSPSDINVLLVYFGR